MKKSKLNRIITIRITCKNCSNSFSIEMLEIQYDKLNDNNSDKVNRRILSSSKDPHISSQMIGLILDDICGYCIIEKID